MPKTIGTPYDLVVVKEMFLTDYKRICQQLLDGRYVWEQGNRVEDSTAKIFKLGLEVPCVEFEARSGRFLYLLLLDNQFQVGPPWGNGEPNIEQSQTNLVKISGLYDGVSWLAVGPESLFTTMRLLQGNVDLWPWFLWSAIMQYNAPTLTPDFADQTGAKTKMLDLWRLSLQFAKDTTCPGIILDLEMYGGDESLMLANEGAAFLNITPDTYRAELYASGVEMANILIEEFPECKIWNLMGFLRDEQDNYSPRYISHGILDRLMEANVSATMICAGEEDFGYFHGTEATYQTCINGNTDRYPSVLRQYPQVSLGASLSLWDDFSACSPFFQSRFEGRVDGQSNHAHDFKPIFDLLSDSGYGHLWIYNHPVDYNTDYDPFTADIEQVAPFNELLEGIRYHAVGEV